MNTQAIRQRLLDPYGYWDIVPEPVLALFDLWAHRLEPEMSETDFVLSYYILLQDLQERRLAHPLTQAPPDLHRLFFVMFPHLVPKLMNDSEEILGLWYRLVQNFAPENQASPV